MKNFFPSKNCVNSDKIDDDTSLKKLHEIFQCLPSDRDEKKTIENVMIGDYLANSTSGKDQVS